MKIELHEIPIRDVANGYADNAEDGVVAYGGRLDVRPAYQREFIYRDAKRDAVIDTVRKNFPLNVMYWVKTDAGYYEMLDGQQRTISSCSYINKEYSINYQYFHNLTEKHLQESQRFPVQNTMRTDYPLWSAHPKNNHTNGDTHSR